LYPILEILAFLQFRMSDPPNVLYATLAGTAVFGVAGFIGAGTVAIFKGHSNQFRYSILTALNTGVFGGIWFGLQPCPTIVC